ncbi:hypothetical protein QQ045_008388 [Rhodiola kirilowii]
MPSSSRAIVDPNMDVDDFVHPGPIDTSLLTMQSVHRTEAIWRNQMDGEFKSHKPLRIKGHNVVSLNPRHTQYVANAVFLPWSQVCNVKINPKLCTVLVERWCPESHTFHLNRGAATITLQDMTLLIDLPIDGEPMSGLAEFEWEPLCLSLLGNVPDRPKLKSMGSKTWFDNYLNHMPADADEETLRKYVRAYILCLLGLTLMLDLYGDQVALHYLPLLADLDTVRRYSWGSAFLAFEYTHLCRGGNFKKSQMADCPLLLQFWSWERMRIEAPQTYWREAPDLEDDIHPFYGPMEYKVKKSNVPFFYGVSMSKAEIQGRIAKDYGLEISYLKAWQSKQQTRINLFGTWDGFFTYLPHVMKALVDASPETIVKWDTEEIDGEYIQVNHVFWAFAECIHAFKHCRPILSIDGTHIYDKYDGKLLVACSFDVNNGVLPVAFALVESENTSSWSWFMRCIRDGVTLRLGLCVISDRHGGIMAAMKEQHGRLLSLTIVSAFTTSRATSTRRNASESFNDVLKHGRDLPNSALVMFTFKQLNKYFNKCRYHYDNIDSAFAPKVHQRLEELRQRAPFHKVTIFNPSRRIYEVITGIKHHKWKFCLPDRTCACGKWTILHIPCSHAIAACKFARLEFSDFVPHEYILQAYNMTWSYHFSPLPHVDFWEPYVGLPHIHNPHFKRTKVGRNPTRRRHNEMDQRDVGQSSTQGEASSSQPPGRNQRCKLCKQTGYNRRVCPFNNVS